MQNSLDEVGWIQQETLFIKAIPTPSIHHMSMTPKSFMPSAPSCIDNSWRSTTLNVVETYLFNKVVSCPFHPRFIYDIYPSSNMIK